MRKLFATFFFLLVGLVILGSRAARSDNMPLSYSDGMIVYGDWGLYRPGAMVPFAEGPYVVPVVPRFSPGAYFPTNRYDPGAYRSPRPKPAVPAEPWYNSWGAQSDSAPATIETPNQGPAVIYAPTFEGRHHDKK